MACCFRNRMVIVDELIHSEITIVPDSFRKAPGLSSPKSLGTYLTYAPSIGLTDELRNCISNIHP